ncbi:hypothetical protein [Lysinibacillus xylanilyticus]|uniref:hypothetical protein n=1 Tax=Lysinibacillus xylanilyticus TaxID=582475 RepID=UPI003CFE6FC5
MFFVKKIVSKFYASLILLFVLFFSMNFSVDAKSTDSADSNVEAFLELKKGQFNITIGESYELVHIRELYGLDDSVIAHYYNVYVNDELNGYILGANDGRLDAILEYGRFDDNIDTKYGEILAKNVNQKAFYLGLDEIEFSDSGTLLEIELNNRLEQRLEEARNANDFEGVKQLQNFEFGLEYNGN